MKVIYCFYVKFSKNIEPMWKVSPISTRVTLKYSDLFIYFIFKCRYKNTKLPQYCVAR